jgi:hypothetical protein
MDNRVSGGCVTAEKGLGERGFGGWGEGGDNAITYEANQFQ